MTPQPADLRAIGNFDFRPTTAVPLCAECFATTVDAPGRYCPRCAVMLANRQKFLEDRRSMYRAIKHAVVITATLAAVAVGVAWALWK